MFQKILLILPFTLNKFHNNPSIIALSSPRGAFLLLHLFLAANIVDFIGTIQSLSSCSLLVCRYSLPLSFSWIISRTIDIVNINSFDNIKIELNKWRSGRKNFTITNLDLQSHSISIFWERKKETTLVNVRSIWISREEKWDK